MYFESIEEFYELINNKKLIIFGTGEMSKKVQNDSMKVEYYVDNDKKKWGSKFCNSTIYNPEILLDENKDNICIIVASMYFTEISKQLESMGFQEDVHFFNGEILLSDFEYFKRRMKFMSYKDKHKGKRGFIIGSGPSLLISDLEKLKNEITFACNKIYLAFDETDWRPTYYAVVDSKVAENNASTISNINLDKFIAENLKIFFNEKTSAKWVKSLSNPIIGGVEEQGFSEDLFKGVYVGRTVTYVMIQIAFYIGIRELYLLGVDFSFEIPKVTGEKSVHGEVLLESRGEINHFHPKYRDIGEKWTMPKLDEQYAAFKVAKKVFEENGGKIYNASRKTKLDVFPIVNLDEIL